MRVYLSYRLVKESIDSKVINQPCQLGRPKHFANSVDFNETAKNERSYQDLHCLPFCFDLV